MRQEHCRYECLTQRIRTAICALAAAASLAATAADAAALGEAGRGSKPAGGERTSASVYRIGAADTLTIDVRNEPQLSGTYDVRPDGKITLPLIGDLRAAGTKPQSLADRLEKRLGAYIRDPVVTVAVTDATGTFESRIRIIGSGVPPRSLPYREGMTALDAVLDAYGRLPDTAAGNSAHLLRRSDGDRRRVPLRLTDLAAQPRTVDNPRLRPGDVMVIPEGFFTGDWQFDQFVEASQTFTDNVDLAPSDEKEAALISEIGPGATLNADLARLQAAFSGSVRYQRQSFNDAGNDLNANLAGNATAEWAENLFFTDVSASVSQQVLDSAAGRSASDASTANRELVQTYRVSPYVVNRFGRAARVETRYTGAVTLIDDLAGDDGQLRFDRGDDDDTSDSVQHTVSLTISSGPRFDRWSWTLTGTASELNFLGDEADPGQPGQPGGRNDDADQSRRDVLLQNRFALSQQFALTGDIGYQKLDSDDATDSFESTQWAIGFRYTPSPNTLLTASAGERNDDRSFSLEARQDISADTSISVTYTEEVASGQERLVANLPDNVEDVDNLEPSDIRFSVRDEVTRTETLAARFNTSFGRNTVGLRGSYATESEDATGGGTSEEQIRFSVDYRRPLTRDVRLNAGAGYGRTMFDGVDAGRGPEDIEDDDYDLNLGLDYMGFQRLSLGARYTFSRRDSTASGDDFTENTVTISGRFRF